LLVKGIYGTEVITLRKEDTRRNIELNIAIDGFADEICIGLEYIIGSADLAEFLVGTLFATHARACEFDQKRFAS
jgi:hypothetical protein